MARGFLSGVILGGVVSVATAGVVSVVAPLATPPQVADAVSNVAAPDLITQTDNTKSPSDSDAALSTAPTSTQSPAPDPDTLTALDAETLSTARQPVTGGADSLTAPAEPTQSGGDALEGDAPVLPNPLALAPMVPEAADELSISTEPAQPQQPETVTVTGAFDDPEQPQNTVDEEAALPVDDAPVVVPSQEVVADETPAETEPASEAPIAEEPVTETAEPETETPQAETAQTETQADTAEATPTTPVFPQPEAEEPVETAALTTAPSIGTPPVNLIDRDSGVSIRRPAGDATSVSVVGDVPTSNGANVRPVERFAQAFQPDGDKPMMSIVLIDDGQSPTNGAAGIAALRSFPYPLSFAVDSTLPDAVERTARLRQEGFEVLAMVDLPAGAQPTDVETTFAATFVQFPEIIGILEGPLASQQSSRAVSDQVTAYLSQSGHGWVTQAKGLNTAATLARREGVPAKSIFRDFDSNGQTAVVIRRFLDQAAFKADQEGGVIMLGRLRPETISALLLWGLQDRAGQVSLAPVSAVLLAEE
jgi:polysaccharide deacetylase 2 family uncharacterized protein YibQ